MKQLIVLVLILTFLTSCEKKTDRQTDVGSQNLFTILSSEESGIDFRNVLKETVYMNGLFYEYFYNGGGVAVADFNGDDLTDIYFISNLKRNALYLNKGNMKFRDVTEISKAGGRNFATGVTTVDINADGRMDLYICNSGRFNDPEKRRNQLLINLGNTAEGIPLFEDRASKYGLDLPHFSTQAAFFDYDLDNDLDMFLINHGIEVYDDNQIEELMQRDSEGRGERLFRNDNGFFTDVTRKAGIINNLIGFGLGIATSDFNNDGYPDIYVSNDFSEKDHLYFNNGDASFEEVSNLALNHMSNFSMGNDAADINNDGWMDFITVDMVSADNYGIKTSMSGMDPKRFYKHVDLGLHNQYMFNTLQLNNGMADPDQNYVNFSEIAQFSGLSNTDWSWSPLFFDMDNDGWNDLFISNGIKRDFRNNDFQEYRKQRRKEAKERSENGHRFDRTKFISSIMHRMPTRKKRNYFFRNNRELSFTNMNDVWADTVLTSSNGAAYADFDNDGDMDLVVNNSDDISFIYQNNLITDKKRNYIKIQLQGPRGNVNGVGSRIKITIDSISQVKEQYLTRGFQSSVDKVIHFGLGSSDQIDQLEIRWPDGKTQLLENIEANQTLQLEYTQAQNETNKTPVSGKWIADITESINLNHTHEENVFDDFAREGLLPHRMSQFGPALATGDVNGDGLDDFYVGGALGFSGALYVQDPTGKFESVDHDFWQGEKKYEDVSALMFDADSDGDKDLYVVSGGNEMNEGHALYQDRLYVNDGHGKFSRSEGSLPEVRVSGSRVREADYDQDGDLDLFVGGRQIPGKYPYPASSYLLRNDSRPGKPIFKNVNAAAAPVLESIGMVTDAVWADVDQDDRVDLIVVGEWMSVTVLKNTPKGFEDRTESFGLAGETGWWYSVAAADFDKDGDVDLVGGNLGLNYKYKASGSHPFEVYASDFDENGVQDIVLGYYNEGSLYPLRGRECSSTQMPFIKKKFPTYNAFGKA
ncbi:FG-GAP-like repeat-containing protein, partial [Fulvivirgaceae bacterium BMA10]|nr:FG-GAP-like repeat-containing protein [Fulvivirgaceae bacterium BMA10]